MKKSYTDDELNTVFHRIYPNIKKDDLNKEQLTIIRTILSGKDTLNILQTGGGKSACYLVPAMLLPGVTLVISPLISLIQDQVMSLYSNHLPVACITGSFLVDRQGSHQYYKNGREKKSGNTRDIDEVSSVEELEKNYSSRKIVRDEKIFLETILAQHEPEEVKDQLGYKIIYMTPERLRTGQFIRFAERANISMIAVDEAHCISLWGYEFRRRYLEIPRFLKRIDQRPVMAGFTATATAVVKQDIIRYLSMQDPVIHQSSEDAGIRKRENLTFSVLTVKKDLDDKKLEGYRAGMIRNECRRLLKLYQEAGKTYCILIYCLTTDQVRNYYESFRKSEDLKDEVTLYYADLDSDEKLSGAGSKQKNWQDFLENRKKIMISTNALGMGVDKGNIRCVIHAGMPMSLENYYQEAGRAARYHNKYAQMKGDCLLFCLENDENICRRLIDYTVDMSGLNEEQKRLRKAIALDRLNQIKLYCNTYLGLDTPLFARDNYVDLDNEGRARTFPEDPQDFIVDYFNNYEPPTYASDKEIEASFLSEIGQIDVLFANRTKISQLIRKGQMKGDHIPVGRRGTAHTVSYEIEGGTLSYLDMMVADAVYTLLKHGRQKIYARHVAGLLSGDPAVMLSPKNTRILEESIRRMSSMRIRIDMSASLRMGFFYDDQMDEAHKPIPVLEGPFLPLKEERSGFSRIDKKLPPLYEYAEIMNGQFHAFSLPLLKVMQYELVRNEGGEEELHPAKRLPASFANMAMAHYLLRRIDSMSIGNSSGRKVKIEGEERERIVRSVTTSTIKLETMLEDLGEFFELERFSHSSPYGRKIREIQTKEELILAHFKIQGYIDRYGPATVTRNGAGTDEVIENSVRITRRFFMDE